jgi:hypothetical protein
VQQHPDATLNELRAWLQAVHGVLPSMGLMWNTRSARADAEKKTLHAAEQAYADIAAARRRWRELQPRLNRERLVFIDG